jgi:hypothetical protein
VLAHFSSLASKLSSQAFADSVNRLKAEVDAFKQLHQFQATPSWWSAKQRTSPGVTKKSEEGGPGYDATDSSGSAVVSSC